MKLLFGLLVILFVYSCETKENNQPDEEVENQHNNEKSHTEEEPKSSLERSSTNCYYSELSNKFDFRVLVDYVTEDSAVINVLAMDKKTDRVSDSIFVQSDYLMLPRLSRDCDDVRSFTTGVNANKEVVDNCHGDFIVADFNFDGQEDFAVKVDSGGNGGYLYAYYLQSNGRFSRDDFLTHEMIFFPVEFDEKQKTLMTSVRANVYQDCERVFQLKGGEWKQMSKVYVP